MSDFIQSEFRENLLFVTIARAEKRNALTPEMLVEIGEAVQSADDHPEVRAVIVRGEGLIFSAGIDVFSLAQSRMELGDRNPARWLRRLAIDLQNALNAIENTEVPVIGALHGKAIGMGLELALSFDLRIASDDCQFSIPESKLGLVADVGGTTRLSRLLGPSRAKDMLFTARSIDAQEALSWGLVNRVVAASDLPAACDDLAQQIMGNAPLAVGLAKRIVDQGDGVDKHTQMAIERWAQSQLIMTEDVQEAMMAFAEKRPPNFKAR